LEGPSEKKLLLGKKEVPRRRKRGILGGGTLDAARAGYVGGREIEDGEWCEEEKKQKNTRMGK